MTTRGTGKNNVRKESKPCGHCAKVYVGTVLSVYCSDLCKQRAKEVRRMSDPTRREIAYNRTSKAKRKYNNSAARGSKYKPVSELTPAQREMKRQRVNAYRALKAGSTSIRYSEDQLNARIAYWGGLCWICRSKPWESLDHVKPLSKGGPDMLSNIRPACSRCNSSKGNKWPYKPNRP